MTVFFDKVRGQWCYDFQLAGVRHRGRCFDATGKKVTSRRGAVAIEAESRTRAKIAGKLPKASELTLLQVITALSQTWQHAPDWPNKRRYAREILAFFGPTTPMRMIDGAKIQDYKRVALEAPVMVWRGSSEHQMDEARAAEKYLKPTTKRTRGVVSVNRSLQVLRAVFKRAYETRDPLTGRRAIDDIPPIEDFPEPKRKATPIPEAAIAELFATLPEYVTDAIRATLYFGFRRAEVFSLKISQIDFDANGVRLQAEDVKNNTDAFIPGGPEAMNFLADLVAKARTRGTPYLITRRRVRKDPAQQAQEPWLPVHNCKTAWQRAMEGIEQKFGRKWRWHDLRAAYITYVAMTSGAVAAQKLARHSDFATTQRYIEVADEITRAAADRAAARPILAVVGGKNK